MPERQTASAEVHPDERGPDDTVAPEERPEPAHTPAPVDTAGGRADGGAGSPQGVGPVTSEQNPPAGASRAATPLAAMPPAVPPTVPPAVPPATASRDAARPTPTPAAARGTTPRAAPGDGAAPPVPSGAGATPPTAGDAAPPRPEPGDGTPSAPDDGAPPPAAAADAASPRDDAPEPVDPRPGPPATAVPEPVSTARDEDATVYLEPPPAPQPPTRPRTEEATQVMPAFVRPTADESARGPGAGTTTPATPAGNGPAGTREAGTIDTPPPADGGDAPTELIPVARVGKPRRRRRALLLAGGVVALLVVLYVADLVQSSGTVPRGVTVAGQEVGGLRPAEAEQRVRAAVEPRTTRPIAVAVGDVTSEIDPRAAGLAVDWPGTIDRAGSQPLNPFTRVGSFFTRREVGVATTADADAVDSALQQLTPVVNRPPAEGSVRFEGVTPVPVPPVDGQEIDLAAAHDVLERDWTSGATVQLPVRVLEPTTTEDDVRKAVADVATPAVAGPVTVEGENVTGTISPEVVAKALSFRPDPDEGLVPELNKIVVQEALDPQLSSSEQPGRDASLSFTGGRPVVTPSQDGRGIDYDATLKDLLTVLTRTGDERRITAVYAAQPAELTTEELNGLGITTVIGEFTTGGFAADSGQNIRRAAQVINGSIVEPGETFSLNAATSPRTAANGYVEAGIISEGVASRGVGGGVSQVATTLYNAAYFAGMTDVTHTPHSFYISRYPPGREATVFEGAIDMQFRNDSPTGVLIQTAWTPSSVTVRLYGTKHYDVTSSTGPRTNPTEPTKVEVPDGQPCIPSSGAPGFTVTDTRTLRDVRTGQVKTERRATKYNPTPIVSCGSD
jgi:vancomycin resistance protein YoaR